MMGFWRALLGFLFLPLYFGGSSSSASTTQTTYNTRDERIAASEGATVTRLENAQVGGTAVKLSGNANTVTTADPEIVRAALQFAANADAAAGITMENILSRQSDAMLVANAQGKGLFSERTMMLFIAAGAVLMIFAARGKA